MTYKISDEEMHEVPGCTPLKIYIVLNNSPNGMTAAELAERLNVPKSSIYYSMSELRKLGTLVQKVGTFSKKLEFFPSFRKEKEKNQKKEESLLQGVYSSSTTSKYREEVLFEWLTADAEYVHLTCVLFELVPEGGGDLSAEIEILRPYIHRFSTWLKAKRVNLEKKGAADCRDHFISWMPSQVKLAKAKAAAEAAKSASPQHNRGAPPTLTKEQQAEQMLQKQRRMEKAAELQRHMEEQNQAAGDVTQSKGYQNIMARLGLDKRKG